MANISYNGYDNKYLTMEGYNVKLNAPVSFKSSTNVIKTASNNEEFVGVSVSSHDDVVAVQTQGYFEVKYSGTAPSYGYCALVCDGLNGVKVDTTTGANKRYIVVKVDTDSQKIGFIK